MTTDTTHITKDQSEARKAEVPETEALKPCPFCGGKCDPEGWIGDKKRSGPACDDCGSAAETVAIWNTRATELSAQQGVGPCIRCGYVGEDDAAFDHHNCAPSVSAQDAKSDSLLGLQQAFLRLATESRRDDSEEAALAFEQCAKSLAEVLSGITQYLPDAQDASPKDGWQPIETAPKDGTHILACCGPYSKHWTFFHRPPAVVHWWKEPGEEGFYLSNGGTPDELPFDATHWMPLSPIDTTVITPEAQMTDTHVPSRERVP